MSFDPGKKTGVVTWSAEAKPLMVNELNEEELDEFLDMIESHPDSPIMFIYEIYVVYGGMAIHHIGKEVLTEQVIGSIRRTARRIKAEIVKVPATNKKIAALWSGTKIPKGHMPDWMAAYLVGYWKLYNMKLIRPRVLDEYSG